MLLTKLTELGITPSTSRPRVSDDNAYIESRFKTMKYTPRFPSGGSKCVDTCLLRTQKFVQDYNFEHRHTGITWVTPARRQEGLDIEILRGRSEVYAAAREENSNRWSMEHRKWKHVESVTLNGQKEPNIKTIAAADKYPESDRWLSIHERLWYGRPTLLNRYGWERVSFKRQHYVNASTASCSVCIPTMEAR